ncbi:hypothetical protein [Noviluteimonas gilva]|uniref:Uncharacterized protein n=1 Tax=Noviluteimonas gilva TaxID=2682097 RepID=A0A7C9MK02_9GAMM|nr:hypothetical protein [Lysobacter gilvus]MUV12587.1 hypothetical protein [Lysobacter gilvus]
MDSWQPVTTAELAALLEAQLADCSLEQKQLFERIKVAPRLAPIDRSGNVEHVFVVAQVRDLALYYEDVEEGFNISPLGQGGEIASPGSEQWELRHALLYFGAT